MKVNKNLHPLPYILPFCKNLYISIEKIRQNFKKIEFFYFKFGMEIIAFFKNLKKGINFSVETLKV